MPFNGSGTFNRLYSWVQDAANGIDILSTRMDNEMNGMATALSDCVTRDGQSPWTANLPAGGFKITGLGTPTSSADSATKGYVDGIAQGEWKSESNSFAWVSATQFKLTGVNLTAIYHIGRRVKITHNGGGSTAYASITASVFGTDTTVTIATDDGSSLVAPVTAIAYGIISYVNPSYLDPRSAVTVGLNGGVPYTATAGVKVQFLASLSGCFDALGEYDSVTNFRFTARHPGYYWVDGRVNFQSSGTGGYMAVFVLKNGNGCLSAFGVLPAASPQELTLNASGLVQLAAGDYLETWVSGSANCQVNGPGLTSGSSNMHIARIA